MRARGLVLSWLLFILAFTALACSQQSNPPVVYVTATVATRIPSSEPTIPNPFMPTPTPFGPTATPLQPTPNPTYPPVSLTSSYTVQAGDTLASIANDYGITVEVITGLNAAVTPQTTIFPGQVLIMPARPGKQTPNVKLIPDSELVNSPSASKFDLFAYVKFQPGFIRVYSEEVFKRQMSGAEIVQFVSNSTSIHPRLLLALLEYKSNWITNPVPSQDKITFPMGRLDSAEQGLFRQLFYAANQLNAAYYGWKYRGLTTLTFADKSRLAYAPDLNPGTVAVQFFLSRNVDKAAWIQAVNPSGFFTTYMSMFGDPFTYTIEPLIPPNLKQPDLQLPFGKNELWRLTGGPHGGWDGNSGWAAIDFAPPRPPDELVAKEGSCYTSPQPAAAMIGGMVSRSGDGAVVIDADMDGDERTGWTMLYLHIAAKDSVRAGTIVKAGAPLGYPSCEGFYLSAVATHLHIARRYNGEWLPADCWACAPNVTAPPWVMSGWRVRGDMGQLYQGWMEKNGQLRRAEQGLDAKDNVVSW